MELVERFTAALTAVSGKVIAAPAGGPVAVIRDLLQQLGIRRVASDCPNLDWSGFELVNAQDADIGVTEADWGIASTGSLVLKMDSTHRRSTSLVPPVHLAILDRARIVADVPTAIGLVGAEYMANPDRPSAVVFVTGPSRTADIELDLVLGVHGPKQLYVVLL